MPKQPTAPLEPLASPAPQDQQPPASTYQKLRGLRQYQHQQKHAPPPNFGDSDESPNDSSQKAARNNSYSGPKAPPNWPEPTDSVGSSSLRSMEPSLKGTEEHTAGLHALDQYFARELSLPMEEQAPEGQQTSEDFRTQSKRDVFGVSVTLSSQQGGEAAEPDNFTTFLSESTALQKQRAPVPASPGTPAPSFSLERRQLQANAGFTGSERSPYREFVEGLSDGDFEYLLDESNGTLQALLLKYSSRRGRSRILARMPHRKRAALLRSLAGSSATLDGDGFFQAFHWLSRKIKQRGTKWGGAPQVKANEADGADYPELVGTKILSSILDGLPPEQEAQILQAVTRDDGELADWLERDRGSLRQRRILRQISREVGDRELALLFGMPHYGRLLRHLLNGEQKRAVLRASIDLARLPREQRQAMTEQLLNAFPALKDW